ncbi:hypothetical protein EX30DRAFT_352581 [Ascodesmis nigricans]|uniref:Uncharacterized protein n=1 Tax=Ascodesmis nigricans TaxID=341454 RepID=A0A4V3SHK1_9PEZI|nr:hypothetical protein EX30DRAFT_352581 [Ascodesmis nigricans]
MSASTFSYPVAPHFHQPRRQQRPKLSLQLPTLSLPPALPSLRTPLSPTSRNTQANTRLLSRGGLRLSIPSSYPTSSPSPSSSPSSSDSSSSSSESSESEGDSDSDTPNHRRVAAGGWHPRTPGTGFFPDSCSGSGSGRAARGTRETTGRENRGKRRVGFVEEVRVFYREFEDEVYNARGV